MYGKVAVTLRPPASSKHRYRSEFRFLALFLLLQTLCTLGAATAVAVELVVPSNRVVTSLNVRTAASATSAVIGKLRPGDAAVLTERVGAWYRITLTNDVVGYVSKSWANIAAELRLGTWNLKKLGHGSSKDYATVAAIIEDNFDILTVIETMQKEQTHPGYDTLMQHLGAGWGGVVTATPRPNTTAGDSEFYAIVYRSTANRPCAGGSQLQYYPDNDGGLHGGVEDRFVREPAFACFETITRSGAKGWDFLLAAYHATWSKGNKELIVAEATHLADVFSAMHAARPGEADLFIAGDFNLGSDILRANITATDRTVGTGSTLNNHGERTTNLYDHLLVFDARATHELVLDAAVLDVRNRAASNEEFYSSVSDHLPIVGHFFRDRADDD